MSDTVRIIEPKKDVVERLVFTGVGSRNIPIWAAARASAIGYHLAESGYVLRSGKANGADYQFEMGVKKFEHKESVQRREIYIPNARFQKPLDPVADHVLQDDEFELCKQFLMDSGVCVYMDKLQEYIQRLFARNVMQVIGKHFSPEGDVWSQFLVYWAPENAKGVVEGGTRIAVYVARYLGIPTYNINIHQQRKALAREIDFNYYAEKK